MSRLCHCAWSSCSLRAWSTSLGLLDLHPCNCDCGILLRHTSKITNLEQSASSRVHQSKSRLSYSSCTTNYNLRNRMQVRLCAGHASAMTSTLVPDSFSVSRTPTTSSDRTWEELVVNTYGLLWALLTYGKQWCHMMSYGVIWCHMVSFCWASDVNVATLLTWHTKGWKWLCIKIPYPSSHQNSSHLWMFIPPKYG